MTLNLRRCTNAEIKVLFVVWWARVVCFDFGGGWRSLRSRHWFRLSVHQGSNERRGLAFRFCLSAARNIFVFVICMGVPTYRGGFFCWVTKWRLSGVTLNVVWAVFAPISSHAFVFGGTRCWVRIGTRVSVLFECNLHCFVFVVCVGVPLQRLKLFCWVTGAFWYAFAVGNAVAAILAVLSCKGAVGAARNWTLISRRDSVPFGLLV